MNTQMIKNSVKNFTENFVCLFIAMGIVYLFLLIAILFFAAALSTCLGDTLSRLSALIETSTEQSSVSVNEFLAYSLEQLPWNGDPVAFFGTILNPAWIRATLRGFFAVLDASTEGFEASFTAIVDQFSNDLRACFNATLVFCSLGITLAGFLTRYAVRRRTAKRGVKKFIIAHTVVPLVQSAILIAALALLTAVKDYALLVLTALLLLSGAVSLVNAWLIHRDGRLKLREILTAQNILSQLAVIGLVLLFNLLLAVLLIWANPILAVLIMIPVAIYSFTIADVNADYFICTQIRREEAPEPAEGPHPEETNNP